MICQWIANLDVTSPNRTGHWIRKYRRNKRNAAILKKLWLIESNRPTAPCLVHLKRLYNPSLCGKPMDEDNYIAGCKGIRDVLAALIVPGLAPGQADSVKYGLLFTYEQTPNSITGIEITFKKIENVDT